MGELSRQPISIFGVGAMGEALVKAILKSGYLASEISVVDKNAKRLEEINIKYGCLSSSPEVAVSSSQYIFLVVKPQDLDELLATIRSKITRKQLLISFVAGKKTSVIEECLGAEIRVLRVMPNIPISVGLGVSAVSKGKYATDEDVRFVQSLLTNSGKSIVVDEILQDAVTATSGSGPAYFFRFVEAMMVGAQDLGLSEVNARILVIQTISGAAAMLNQEGADPRTLRENVTSPNGTTYAALEVLENGQLEGLVKLAMKAARDRSQELS